MLRVILALLLIGVAGLVGHGYYSQFYPPEKRFETDKIVRTDIVEQVAVSGTAEPLQRRMVQADIPQGAVVEEVLVDFNTPVTKNQLLARLADDEQRIQFERAQIAVALANSVKKAAEAGLESAKQGLVTAQAKEEGVTRSRSRLNGASEEVVPAADRENVDLVVRSAHALVQIAKSEIKRTESLNVQAEKGIENAKHMLRLAELQTKKTELRSPIDGFVFNMDLHVGDIVGRPKFNFMEGASAPFEIASPLDRMRAVVKLSEADYSRVRPGQNVLFTVEAYPDEKFTGKVLQIRNAPSGDKTAVTYPTVIEFKNRQDKNHEWMIRPRATVSADIQLLEVKKALAAPNAALLYSPRGFAQDKLPPIGEGEGIVWVRGGNGRPAPKKIRKGISNGTLTQILEGDLREGDLVITAEPDRTESGFQGLPIGG